MEKHVVMFSTGLSSAITLDLVQQKYGKENTVALLTDTKWEDEDNYRFANEVIEHLGANLEYRAEGRTPPEIWMLGYLVGPTGAECTRTLKRKQTQKFLKEHKGEDIVLHFGIGSHEEHRTYSLTNSYSSLGAECRFPLVDKPMANQEMVSLSQEKWGIKIPRMYHLGFSHANCGGRCVKAGQSHYIRLMLTWPERFKEMVELEKAFQIKTGSDTTILRAKRNGVEVKLPLSELQAEYDNSLKGQIQWGYNWNETPCECVF